MINTAESIQEKRSHPPEGSERNRRRVLWGVVVSDRMQKTITVRVERRMKHPKYAKYIRAHKKCHAHDEEESARIGDMVEIIETRPLSKLKRFRLLRVMDRAKIRQSEEEGS